ncbi:hypothetical protein DICPUDRAFT_50323 [Dictyostelium purpureum]|uniref:5-oxoprolinase n=1 Tax=Dictyostelium purpureum TaxID=5786 RepID=F0ZXZ7_DICPU|nr:uncharacterized protein DICPUDRAFT_50323 [Dictyostelium purpureum]EGC31170.1 hypothetical protein DICPUDRAFT_50323 [Dictyostelium purpureum]|eukprot:XP_003292290.1 hypothetical protein DICPUDRAFT_50323 [Dictyostelium purpureum]
MKKSIKFNIDRGGTFTDIYAEFPFEPYYIVEKLLSVDPDNYSDAPREGIRRILERIQKKSIPKDNVDTTCIKSIRMGTTVGTNALLERKGERVLLVTSEGFKDLLQIGNQARPKIFDLNIVKPDLIYDSVLEVEERVQIINNQHLLSQYNDEELGKLERGTTGDYIKILKEPNLDKIKKDLTEQFKKGIKSVAIVFIHSYTFNRHEEMVGKIAQEVGFTHISLSHQLMPMIKAVPRGLTSCVDAYLTPLIELYIKNFEKGFDKSIKDVDISFMMSDGGLCPVDSFRGFRSILSGPAGGVVGYSKTTHGETGSNNNQQPIIGFDMGGTSTDVSRYSGSFDHVFETEISGLTIQAPQLDIHTVAAGGGSRLFFKSGLFNVGPESVGAHPGPVCYKKKGNLAITDANLLLGRLLPQFFPSIFGPNQNEPLDYQATLSAFQTLTQEINNFQSKNNLPSMSEDEVAFGFIRVANEAMCRPIRNITEAKGYDCFQHILACFGGAGGQHACAIAQNLGMPKVYIHRFSGILSAYGLGLADLVIDKQEPCSLSYNKENQDELKQKLQELMEDAKKQLLCKGFNEKDIICEGYLNLRFSGTDTSMMVKTPDNGDYEEEFKQNYKREYGFIIKGRDLLIDDIRVRVYAKGSDLNAITIPDADPNSPPKPELVHKCYFESTGRTDTPVFLLKKLGGGDSISGPAIIIDNTTTIVVEPDCKANILKPSGNIEIIVGNGKGKTIDTKLDPIILSVFSHRFMSIAEQMGRTLQRTSISTNIKERLDFSCAIFSPDGSLVANAPHLPVHLGSMQEAVKYQVNLLKNSWKEGEVILSNHPQAGGSHLPDMTVMTPVYHKGEIVFFVASRGHHADIGGITPGSMPPFSKSIHEEGAAIKSLKIVENGHFQEDTIREVFAKSRNLADNLSDLKAQIAANRKGISLMEELINHYGLEVVHAYMHHVQNNAELAVRDMLYEISLANKLKPVDTLISTDYMDDGSKIELKLTIDREQRTAIFDWSGTGPEVFGNTNAPPSVTYSATIYSLRSMVKRDIPLNQGCLNPITTIIPPASILNPTAEAAVVGGNVLTSQRVTDIILAAFKACANSQGCMNNLTFGDETLGYYETIAGGSGAGPTFNGFSGVQCHMTNTRITDVEIMEKRYPVLVKEYSIRKGSGGDGKYKGGDGVIREIEFLKNFTVSILSERRCYHPKGLEGGQDAECGENLVRRKDGKIINIGGKNTIDLNSNESIIIKSPGGGGFGSKN